jgi:hypothetical protein
MSRIFNNSLGLIVLAAALALAGCKAEVPTDSEAPVIYSANATGVVTGIGGTFQVMSAYGFYNTSALSGAVPGGVSINADDGLINIAAGIAVNVYTFDITVTNSAGADSQTFTLTVSDPLSGAGTIDDPYQIASATQLGLLVVLAYNGTPGYNGNSVYYQQTENLDLSAYANWPSIWSDYSSTMFTAAFDGNGHTITNLTISLDVGTYGRGLFDYIGIGGVIKNIALSGTVTGDSYVGGVAGYNSGTITNCSFTGTVTGGGGVGGVAGHNSGTITASYNTGTVTGDNGVGGVAGSNGGTITASRNTGTVTGDYGVGGVAGSNGGTITASYNTGNVTGTNNVGGVVGGNKGWPDEYATFTASYNTGNVTGISNVGGVAGSNDFCTITASYWTGTVTKGDADFPWGIGSGNSNNAAPFGDTGWPTADTNTGSKWPLSWGIVDGSNDGAHTGTWVNSNKGYDGSGQGYYWKSLGGWNDGAPVYPKLWWELPLEG